MTMSHCNGATPMNIASIRAPVPEPFHDAFQYTNFRRCIGTLVDNGNRAHKTTANYG